MTIENIICNNINKINKMIVNPDNFWFDLFTLYAWIRYFECLLPVSYRLPFKSWQVGLVCLLFFYKVSKIY